MLQFRGIVVKATAHVLVSIPRTEVLHREIMTVMTKMEGQTRPLICKEDFDVRSMGGLRMLCETSPCATPDLETYLPKPLWFGTHGTHTMLLTTTSTDTCGTMRRPEFSAVTCMEKQTNKQTNQNITSTYFNLTTATTFCVSILWHRVAYTVNDHRTSRVYLLFHFFLLWPVFNRVTLQDNWLLTALRHSLVACYSAIVRKSFQKTFKTFFFCCCLKVVKVLESQTWLQGNKLLHIQMTARLSVFNYCVTWACPSQSPEGGGGAFTLLHSKCGNILIHLGSAVDYYVVFWDFFFLHHLHVCSKDAPAPVLPRPYASASNSN